MIRIGRSASADRAGASQTPSTHATASGAVRSHALIGLSPGEGRFAILPRSGRGRGAIIHQERPAIGDRPAARSPTSERPFQAWRWFDATRLKMLQGAVQAGYYRRRVMLVNAGGKSDRLRRSGPHEPGY